MRPATAARSAAPNPNPLSQALADSNAAARLAAFVRATGCSPLDVSSDQGKSLDWLSVLDVMRRRGYTVGEPVRPQAQTRRGSTAWLVTIGIRAARVTLVFYTQNEQP